MLRQSITLFLFVLLAAQAVAQGVKEPLATRSRTGQFVVRSMPGNQIRPRARPVSQAEVAGTSGFVVNPRPQVQSSGPNRMKLEPALLIVSCERVKELLLRELHQTDQWRGRVDILLNPAQDPDEAPVFTAIRRPNGWTYQLVLATEIAPRELLRHLTYALLLEIADRQSGPESTELPLWLVEGLAANLQANNLPTYLVEPDVETFGDHLRLEGLDAVRAKLNNVTRLTFQEMSWPDANRLAAPEQRDLFRTCAQFFVHELLELKNGPADFGQLLAQLPRRANWQIAFLDSFHDQFKQLRDVEKWWGLLCVNFTGRDLAKPLTREQAVKKLNDSLDIPAQIHLSAERMPVDGLIRLQDVIKEWDDKSQMETLQRTFRILNDLQIRVAPEIAALIREYESAISDYVNQRQVPHPALATKNETSRFAASKMVTCRELNRLDEKLSRLQKNLHTTRSQAEEQALKRAGVTVTSTPAPVSPLSSPKSR